MPQTVVLRPYVLTLPDAASAVSFDPAAEQKRFWRTPVGRLFSLAVKAIWRAAPAPLDALGMDAQKLKIGTLLIVAAAYNDPHPPESVRERLCDHRESEPRCEAIKRCPFPCWAVSAIGREGATIVARAKAPGVQRVLELSFNGASGGYAEAYTVIGAVLGTLRMLAPAPPH